LPNSAKIEAKQVKLLVVMRADSPLVEHRGPDDVLLPATASAFLGLRDSGIAFEIISNSLGHEDYGAIWQDSVETSWRLVDACRLSEQVDGPDLGLMHAYPVFIALTQMQVMARGLTRLRAAHAISEVVVENGGCAAAAEVFWPDVSLYADTIRAWAAEMGIPCSIVETSGEPGAPSLPPAADERRPVSAISVSRIWASISYRSQAAARRMRATWSAVKRLGRTMMLLIRGPRRYQSRLLLFYTQHLGLNDPQHAPANAFDVRSLSETLRRVATADHSVLARSLSALEATAKDLLQSHGWIGRIVKDRLMACAAAYGAQNIALFGIWLRILRRLRSVGWRVMLMADGPYTTFSSNGMLAEAFRCGNARIAEVAHGGNCSWGLSSGNPDGLTVGPADFVFHWGKLGKGEIGDRLLSSVRHVRTGSIRSHVLRSRTASARHLVPEKPMVLYAPTILSPMTMYGSNIPWDRYLPILDAVFGTFARAPFRTVVSYLRIGDMERVVERWRSSPIEFRPHSFSRWLPEADYIVVDCLSSSTIYEALTTDKPILCYAAAELQEWDPEFMAALRRRVVCCENAQSYLACIGRLAADPAAFFAAEPRTRSDEVLQMVAPPATEEDFWKIVRTSVVEATSDRVAAGMSRRELRGSGTS
jgi:hypothetical protein